MSADPTHYFHGGAFWSAGGSVDWSDQTRRSLQAARKEAAKMARKKGEGWEPCVERWLKEHGLRPGWDCAEEVSP